MEKELNKKEGKTSNKKEDKSYLKDNVRNQEWEKIKDRIKEKKEGRTGQNERIFLNGILWILRIKTTWLDLPPDHEKWPTVHKRFLRWAKNGKWERLAKVLNQNIKLKKILWQRKEE